MPPGPVGPEAAGPTTPGTGAPGPATGAGRATMGWAIGLAVYGIEVLVVGFLGLLFGGLSAILSDTCFSESTELICEPRWQTITAATPITALFLTVIVTAVVMVRTRAYWSLALALVAIPIVPLVAFLIMQAVVTA